MSTELPGQGSITRVALTAVAVALLLAAIKLAAWLASGAVSLLASCLDSLMDAVVSAINLGAVRIAAAPPDREHRFGHGKVESLAGLLQSLAIGTSAIVLMVYSTQRLLEPEPVFHGAAGIAVIVISMLVTGALVVYQRRVAAATGSLVIRADELHFRSDLLVNAGILVALVMLQFGWPWADALCGLLVGVWILVGAGGIGWDSAQMLLDRELDDAIRARVLALCRAHPQVQDVHGLRSRRVGRVPHFQLDLGLPGDLALVEAHAIGKAVADTIRDEFPGADVIVHHDPL